MKSIILAVLFAIASSATLAQMISESEQRTILRMREEEKMTRDFYLAMNEKWNQKVFANIAENESYHMSQIFLLVEKYKLNDPIARTGDERGVYIDSGLQLEYNELIAAGNVSLKAALKAGAKMEENDIVELRNGIAGTSSKEIAGTYKYLLQYSANHLNALVQNLEKQGVTYQPEFLDKADYNNIRNNKVAGTEKVISN